MRRQMVRTGAVLLAAALLALPLTGCKLTESKARQLYKEAITQTSALESGEFEADIQMDLLLDGSSGITMSMGMKGAMADQGRTSALELEMDLLGQQISSQTYTKDGKVYTKTAQQDRYLVSDYEEATGMSLDDLLSINQDGMVQLYTQALDNTEDFTFAEDEQGIEMGYTFPQASVEAVNQELQGILSQTVLAQLEEQVQSSMEQQMELYRQMMPSEELAQLEAMLESQVGAVTQMVEEMLTSMTLDRMRQEISLTPQGEVTRQLVDCAISFDLGGLSSYLQGLGLTPDSSLPQTMTVAVVADCKLENLNQELQVEMPQFTPENTMTQEEALQGQYGLTLPGEETAAPVEGIAA